MPCIRTPVKICPGGFDDAIDQRSKSETARFVQQVDHLTFSGPYAGERGLRILYITERAVFELTEEALHLIEPATGIDLEADILGQLKLYPEIAGYLKSMDTALFRE